MRLNDPSDVAGRLMPAGLVSAVERLAGARSREDVVETLRSTARRVAGADGICIVLRDEGQCFYIEEDAIGPLWKGSRFPLATCISGWVMTRDQTVVIPDVFLDDRIPHAIYRPTFVKSLVMTPIGSGEPIAALGAYWARTYAAPKEVVETLEALARAAATALENVYLIGALSASLRKMELAREELRRRVRTVLGAVQAFGDASLPPEHAAALALRVEALSRAHAVFDRDRDPDGPILLSDLLAAELQPYRGDDAGRVGLSGPEVRVSGAQAIALGLVLSELAAHASRHGVLSYASGQVSVRWREEAGVVMMEWREFGGLAAKRTLTDSPAQQFARQLVHSQLGGSFRGFVDSEALTCLIEFPNETAKAFPSNA